MIGDRFKERPSDCAIESHALMVRGGYMKSVANGIYSQFPPLKRITAKKVRKLSVTTARIRSSAASRRTARRQKRCLKPSAAGRF